MLKVNKLLSRVEVTDIAPFGPVHQCGKIKFGDVLRKVNGRHIGESLPLARELLSGESGSRVELTFCRPENLFGLEGLRFETEFSVTVQRACAPYGPCHPLGNRSPSSISCASITSRVTAHHRAVYDVDSEERCEQESWSETPSGSAQLLDLVNALERQGYALQRTLDRYQSEIIRTKEAACRARNDRRAVAAQLDAVLTQLRQTRQHCHGLRCPAGSGSEASESFFASEVTVDAAAQGLALVGLVPAPGPADGDAGSRELRFDRAVAEELAALRGEVAALAAAGADLSMRLARAREEGRGRRRGRRPGVDARRRRRRGRGRRHGRAHCYSAAHTDGWGVVILR